MKKNVYDIIINNPFISKDNIASALDISKSTVSRAIKKLKEKEYICREGSDKTGKWIILKEI